MKAQSECFRRKNSKQGLALSTSMAICIVLAILVAVLVSMATLNITTTQTTVYQRDAYITAKSALAFVESYYSQHDIPGKEDTEGTSLVIFNDDVVAKGAKIYLLKDPSVSTTFTPEQLDALKTNCKKVYVDVSKTGELLDMTAHCKYGDGNFYEMSREFNLGGSNEIRPNSFTGNVSYEAKSDTRFLRIHVRTNPAFGEAPYLWTWYNMYNPNEGDSEYGKSSLVNKLAYDDNYPADHNGGSWSDTEGIGGNCAMQYEGNGWYLTTIKFGTEQNVNFVNAIVARNGAKRSEGNDAQSWELFGIPVPLKDQVGEANGLDVYITLNRKRLIDARNENGGKDTDDLKAPGDMFTYYFRNNGNRDVNEFAKFCGSWYTVYIKNNTSTMHYRLQGKYKEEDYTPGEKPAGFTYEGYGWFRKTVTNYTDANTIEGYAFGEAAIVSQNEFGQEQVREGFICKYSDGSTELFGSEAAANEAFAMAGDLKAGDYVTVNVKSAKQPVDKAVPTTIHYESKWNNSDETKPASSDPNTTDPNTTDPNTTDPNDPNGSGVAYSPSKEKLEFKQLDTLKSFAVIGTFNNWGVKESGGTNRFENILDQRMTFIGDQTYELRVNDCAAGRYEFKVIELAAESGNIGDKIYYNEGKSGWDHAYGVGTGNYIYDLTMNNRILIITYNDENHSINVRVEVGDIDTTQTYGVIGFMNEWGTVVKDNPSQRYNNSSYEGVDPMTFDVSTGTYVCNLGTSNIVESTKEYKFKVIKTTGCSGDILDWKDAYGMDGQRGGDAKAFLYIPPLVNGNHATFTIKIHFNPADYSITVVETPTGVSGEDFYLIGNYNNWGTNHTFNSATSDVYKFNAEGTIDSIGRYIYTYTTPDLLDPGDYEVKVISNQSAEKGKDPGAPDSIDYGHSWGEQDDDEEKKTYGKTKSDDSPRLGFKFTLEKASKVEVTFFYDPTNMYKSTITYTTISTVDVKSIYVKFYNAKGKDENGDDTEFTKWDELYVTYKKPNSVPVCRKIEFTSSNAKSISVPIPEDSSSFYFSNQNSTGDRSNNYQCTQEITFKKGYAGRTFRPTHYVDDANSNSEDHKSWLVTTESATPLDSISETKDMVYSGGSGHCNLYDAPLVTVLKMIVTEGKMTGNYAFAAYPYTNYEVKEGNNVLCTVNFSTENKFKYQGDTYYYQEGVSYKDSGDGDKAKSFLIVQDTAKSHTGYLLEDQMALMTNVSGLDHHQTKMQNRAGASFPSDTQYYNKDAAYYNFGGYTPSWYTYKVPVTKDMKIVEIKGVFDQNEVFFNGQEYFEPANATENFKQPIYIFQDYKNASDDEQKDKFYTYDTNVGTVDTNTADEVSVYFANEGSGDEKFEKIGCYAYNPEGVYTDDQDLKRDYSDGDNKYYRFRFKTGDYCYFIFYDSSEGDFSHATKKTKTLFLDGYEDPDTRAYNILARDVNATSFSPYIHPRTQALFAAISIDSASRAARIASGYSYDSSTKTYKETGTYKMNLLDEEAEKAWNYYKDGNSNVWTSTNPKKYMDLANAVQEFTTTLTQARIYIAQDPDEHPGTTRVYKECSYRSSTFDYQERWVNLLINEYDNAVKVFDKNNGNQTNAQYLRQCSANINALIASPLLDWNSNTVQIIVNDQQQNIKNEETGLMELKGGWGSSNIHLYNKDGDNWVDTKYDLYKTTQSDQGFYAYVFKITTSSKKFMISQTTPAADVEGYSVDDGHRYMFITATETFENDGSSMVYKITDNEVIEGRTSGAYSWFDLRPGDKKFTVQFLYDTHVKGKSKKQKDSDPEPVEQDYTVFAGCYTISPSYAGFNKDLSKDGKQGIDLFSENAKKFFTNPANYSMNSANSYSTWSADVSGKANIDIMCDRINKKSQISASTSKARKVSFRYKNVKDNDKLTLKQNVNLSGGAATIAVNNLDLGSYDMIIDTKTVTFLTDTVVTTTGGTFTIGHGTYAFNTTDSSKTFRISLQTTGGSSDWRDNFTVISNSSSKLRGGYYITNGSLSKKEEE